VNLLNSIDFFHIRFISKRFLFWYNLSSCTCVIVVSVAVANCNKRENLLWSERARPLLFQTPLSNIVSCRVAFSGGPHPPMVHFRVSSKHLICSEDMYNFDKKLIRRWDSERELSSRRHRTRTTKYNRLVHKCRHRSTRRLCVGTHVYQIQWNNAM